MRKRLPFILLGIAWMGCEKRATLSSGPSAPAPSVLPSSASAVPLPSNTPTTHPIPKLVVNESIGPLRLGMTRAEVEALMPLTPDPSKLDPRVVAKSGAYSLVFGGEQPLPNAKLESISYSLTEDGGLYIGDRLIESSVDFEKIPGLLPNCVRGASRGGGTWFTCSGRTRFMRPYSICETRDAKGVCQNYSREHRVLQVRVSTKPKR